MGAASEALYLLTKEKGQSRGLTVLVLQSFFKDQWGGWVNKQCVKMQGHSASAKANKPNMGTFAVGGVGWKTAKRKQHNRTKIFKRNRKNRKRKSLCEQKARPRA